MHLAINKNILAESNREKGDTPIKLSVVGPAKSGIWRRERIRMTDQEMDDVAFLTGRIAINFLSIFLSFLKNETFFIRKKTRNEYKLFYIMNSVALMAMFIMFFCFIFPRK